MPRYAAFLRGVNLGSTRKVSGADLCSLFEDLGFEDVASFRNSGNVALSGERAPAAALAARIEEGVAATLGFESAVLVRSAPQMRELSARRPFTPAQVERSDGKLQVMLLAEQAPCRGQEGGAGARRRRRRARLRRPRAVLAAARRHARLEAGREASRGLAGPNDHAHNGDHPADDREVLRRLRTRRYLPWWAMATVPELNPSQVAELGGRLRENIARAVKVSDDVLRDLLVALIAEGHVLIEDYPGVGKTALARALASSVDAEYARVQCTADLLPADVVGTNVYNQRENRFEFRPGPVFANVVLVDEVNRASPKTQSGLLECMQERHVTVDKHTHEIARPFIVLATQNPIEYEGTYPLPEAQLDRFMVRVSLGYPSTQQESDMLLDHAERDRVLDLEPVTEVGEVRGRAGGGRRRARQRGPAPLRGRDPGGHARRLAGRRWGRARGRV